MSKYGVEDQKMFKMHIKQTELYKLCDDNIKCNNNLLEREVSFAKK